MCLSEMPYASPNNLGPDESGVSVNETLFRGMIGSLMYLKAAGLDILFSTCSICRYKHTLEITTLLIVNKNFQITGGGVSMLECKKKQSSVAILLAKLSAHIVINNKLSSAISNNPMLHSRTKHIDIRYHFIRDHILKGDIELHFVPTDLQLANIFTKPLAEPSFTRLVAELESTSSQQSQLLPSSKALTLQPSAMYVEYLKEFWYTADVEVETKTIAFSLSW
ncbi:hypothetical protein Tco_1143073 [Tanacetum coccineum]